MEIVGVLSVLVKNYANEKTVVVVLIIHLLQAKNVNFGVNQMIKLQEPFQKTRIKNLNLFVPNVKIFLKHLLIILNSWCPFCVNKTEKKLYDFLTKIFLGYTIISQFKAEWCKNKTYLPFDFCIVELKLIIELDDRQHFEQVKNWDNPDSSLERDIFKMSCALSEGYRIIRIFQEDVWREDEEWIFSQLNPLINENFQIVYISTIQNLYKKHYNLMKEQVILKFVD